MHSRNALSGDRLLYRTRGGQVWERYDKAHCGFRMKYGAIGLVANSLGKSFIIFRIG